METLCIKDNINACQLYENLGQLNQISSLTEKRPSITEKELTPIVLNQLQSTKKHKVGISRSNWGKQNTAFMDFNKCFLRMSCEKPEEAVPLSLRWQFQVVKTVKTSVINSKQ